MAELQETLIYVEKENIEEAEFMSRNFVTREIKTRAYLNALGAELIIKYIKSEGIDTNNLHNLHSISKILEKYDIADVLLPNIHIDARVVFDKKQLFIPKSHFENEIKPDVYAFLIISKDFETAKFIGYCEASAIDKNKANTDYYFVDADQLATPESFAKFIKNYVGKNKHSITEEEMLRGRQLSVSLADHNITKFEEKELLELLLLSDELRESVLEFDNFETLAYSAAPDVVKSINETGVFTAAPSTENIDIVEESDISDTKEDLFGDNMLEDNITLEEESKEELEDITSENNIDIDNNTEEITETNNESEIEAEELEEQPVEHNLSIDEEALAIDTTTLETPNLSVDDILDQTIASIDADKSIDEDQQAEPKNSEPSPSEEDKKDNVAGKVITAAAETAATIAGAAITGAAGATAAKTAAEASAAGIVSEGAMKLAGVSGEIIDNVVDENIHKQSENLDKIDSSLVGTNPEAIEISAESEALGKLSASKIEQNIENEKAFAPKDLSQLDKVDTIASESKEQRFEHETIDMAEMETVENDLYRDEEDSGVDIDTLTDLEAVEKKENELTEAHILSESEVVDLPESMEYSINDDGTSSFDDIMMDKNMPPEEDTDNLIDMAPIDDENIIGSLNFDEISETSEDAKIQEPDLSVEATDIEIPQDTTIENTLTKDATENLDLDLDGDINLDMIDAKIDSLMEEELTGGNVQADIEPSATENIKNEEILDNIDSAENSSIETVTVEDFSSELFEEEKQETSSNTEYTEQNNDSKEKEEAAEDEIQIEDENEEISIEEFENMLEGNDEKTDELKDDSSIDDFLGITDNAQEVSLEDQDWLSDTPENTINTAEELSTEDIIEEAEIPAAKTLNVIENSTVISDKTFTPGEIAIDINNSRPIELEGSESLEKLYNPNSPIPGEALLNNPGRMSAQKDGAKSPLGAILGVVGLLIMLTVIGAVGFGVAKMFKAPKEEAPQPITDDAASLNMDAIKTDNGNTLDVNPNNVVSMDNNKNALASTTGTTASSAGQSAVTAARTTGTATAFVEIKKLSWEIPDYISQNASFKQYFQSVGKSIKNALTADLLLATDYIYSSPVKISVTFDKDGTFKNSQIINSSGSTQIDSIVLQTVNQTLKVLKAPNSIGNDQSTTALLKIYF